MTERSLSQIRALHIRHPPHSRQIPDSHSRDKTTQHPTRHGRPQRYPQPLIRPAPSHLWVCNKDNTTHKQASPRTQWRIHMHGHRPRHSTPTTRPRHSRITTTREPSHPASPPWAINNPMCTYLDAPRCLSTVPCLPGCLRMATWECRIHASHLLWVRPMSLSPKSP